ncbi:CCA tRNA nucleotidyltransferase [Pseudooctadecabacter jejudonensis]|uniref:CCA-adding enzyme n=1 Tax=Pseudooctadecabacter jejudonensis TaxID=1391910 RepID=A0A1Y5S6I4_9RHOB|nr:CCA tRNA nucleotidyltransferase [Pseudooctadecabacter jejudonensis]SLN33661.1 CCA-adding enzyme [Pseudooctadecabacter jejudonensis]
MTEASRILWGQDGTLRSIGQPAWLTDPDLAQLMQGFEDAGQQIYAVGGCVRDTVIEAEQNVPPNEPRVRVNDVDLATDAVPSRTVEIIERLSDIHGKPWKAVPTGIDHGTISAIGPRSGQAFEITTFRRDVDTDGRHATVAFSDTVAEDAQRRDFTMNAFYADRQGNVIDPVGGSADLKARHVRFIGDPMQRIEEDYLRILRFFRFTGSHGRSEDGIDADGLAACAMGADGLDGVSRERIGAEVVRIMGHPDPAPTIGSMEMSGVLARILPGAGCASLARLVDLEGAYPAEDPMLSPADVPTRLASLGCDDIVDRLRLSKDQARKIALVRQEAGAATPPHELSYRHGFWPAVQCLLLRWASLLSPFDATAIADLELGAQATFPITARDLMPEYSGKALGDRLAKLEAAWIASKFTKTKTDLMKMP